MEFDGTPEKLIKINLEFNNKSVEETLLEIGKWALISLRIPGYFPLTICQSNYGLRLELVRCSTVTFYTIFITILSMIGSIFGYYSFIKKFWIDANSDKSVYGNTESFIWFLLIVLITYTTYLRLSRIFFCQGSLKFWKKTINLIETMNSYGYKLNSIYFFKVLSSISNWVLFYFTIICIRITYGSYKLYMDLINPTLENNVLAASFLDYFLAFTICFHVGYSIWLTFLIKLIIICYEIIHEDLDDDEDEDDKHRRVGTLLNNKNNILNQCHTNASQYMGLGYYNILLNEHDHSEINNKKNQNQYIQLENKIQQTLNMYEIIEEHIHEFNRFFGLTLIIETTFAVILLIVYIYAGETAFNENATYTTIVMGIPIIMYTSSLYLFSSESSILSGRAVSILKKLERFIISNNRQQLQTLQLKVIAMIARVADNPPSISAGHFFTMNRHLLTAVLGTVTTNLIVLLQFRDSDKKGTITGAENGTGVCSNNLTWICSCSHFITHLKNSNLTE